MLIQIIESMIKHNLYLFRSLKKIPAIFHPVILKMIESNLKEISELISESK